MKITAVDAVLLAIPYAPCDPPSPWTETVRRQLLVRVATDAGLEGWGEAFALGAPRAVVAVVEDVLRPLLLGEPPTDRERLVERLHRAVMLFGRRGVGMFALSGVELALWDLAGQALGVPVHVLLGGAVGTRVPAYASLLRYAGPDAVAHAAARAVTAGFRAIKLHQTDPASVRAAREAVGAGVTLMLDVNCAWTVAEAIGMGRALASLDLAWLEEPVWPPEDYRALARVVAAVPVPVAAGENEATAVGFRELILQGRVPIVQPSVTKAGGLDELRKVCVLAEAAGRTVAPHSFYFGPGLAATVHLAAVTGGIPWVELPFAELATPLLHHPVRAEGGAVAVPAGPGLGVEVNPDALRYATTAGAAPFTIATR